MGCRRPASTSFSPSDVISASLPAVAAIDDGLQHSAHGQVEDEGEPEGVVAHRRVEQHVGDEECGHGPEHRQQQSTRHRGPDEDPVPCECRESGEWHGERPYEILARGSDDVRVVAQQPEESFTAAEIKEGEKCRPYSAPHEKPPHTEPQAYPVARADKTPHKGFPGKCEAIHHI